MQIEKERIIESTPSHVWEVLTNTAYIEKWLGVKAVSSWKVNDDIAFKFSWDGKIFEDRGKLIAFDQNRRFTYTYWSNFSGLPDQPENYSQIQFEIISKGKESLLKLTHSEIKNQTMYEHSDKNWEETLDQIKTLTESID